MCCVRGVLDVLHQCLESICISDSPANDSRASLNQSTPAAQYKVTESRLGQSRSKGIRSATSLAQALSGGVRTAAGVYCASVLTRRAGDV